MNFAGMIKQSLVDYPGKIATVLFTRGCNFYCPFCHNAHLLYKPGAVEMEAIGMNEITAFLQERTRFLDAVVISGGEPTLHADLPDVLRTIKNIGYLTKLDTNGSNTQMLGELMADFLLDYAAMDVKGVLEYKRYKEACGGRLSSEEFLQVKSSIYLLSNTDMEVEFRTTVVPGLHTPQDIVDIARYLEGARKYSIQQFNPRYTLDPGYQQVVPYSREELQDIAGRCRPYIQEVRVLNT